MREGDVIAARFEVERRAGAGGMGEVFRARDLRTGREVALKTLHQNAGLDPLRFAREAEILASLDHPGIVRYVAHGITEAGMPYLAMDWLEGQTLSDRLAGKRLTIAESVALGERIAATLGFAHRRGLVHRDLKPGNILLLGGSIEAPVLLDFGIARRLTRGGAEGTTLTEPGAMLGTPGYIAPEQAKGEGDVGPQADVFSLGCVLFKCLTGRRAFEGEDALAVLLKVVLEEPSRLRDLRPEAPQALEALLARMLAKSKEARPRDGEEVAAALASLEEAQASARGSMADARGAPEGSPRASSPELTPEITGSERRVMCLVVVERAAPSSDPLEGTTLSEGEMELEAQAYEAVIRHHGGQPAILCDGSLLGVLTSAGAATDLAMSAARCALSLRSLLEGRRIAVVSGRAELSSRLPAGEIIERAVTLLRPDRDEGARALIRLDTVTVGLLGAGFDVAIAAASSHALLLGQRGAFAAARTLLGRPTPCVGREREIAMLDAIFATTLEEGTASAALVTAAPGVGKSRLRHEFVRRLHERGERVDVWMGRGDPVAAGSPFGLLSQALRGALGLLDGAPLDERRAQLRAEVEHRLARPPSDHARVSTFLGEIVGAPLEDEGYVQLRAARRDPMLMYAQMERAFVELAAAACATRPLLVVLEDLHWGDLPTVKLIDAALRELRDAPLMVLALARPEVHAVFPELWADRPLQTLQLGELGRRASERLVRLALGEGVSAEVVKATVERAEGNAFYLEELIRAVAEGHDGAPPETVLAMVQARIESLEPEARRVLRAASIFGETFWAGGVAALVAGEDVPAWLRVLREREVITTQAVEGDAGEAEYAFRHALVREAAYGMLTERDRAVGHGLAGAWLARLGKADPMVIADHFLQSGARAEAVVWFKKAAEKALEANDFDGVISRIERALACGVDEEQLGELMLLCGEAHWWRGAAAEAVRWARKALPILPRGRSRWLLAASMIVAYGGAPETDVAPVIELLAEPWSPEDVISDDMLAMSWLTTCLMQIGANQLADELQARLEAASCLVPNDPQIAGAVLAARAFRALLSGDPNGYREMLERAAEGYEGAGDLRMVCRTRTYLGYAYNQIGAFEEAERRLRGLLEDAKRLGLQSLVASAKASLGAALAKLGGLEEARGLLEEAAATYMAQRDDRLEGSTRIYLASILLRMGDEAGAEREARRALELLTISPPFEPYAHAQLAEVLLARGGRVAEALAHARAAMAPIERNEHAQEGEALVRLTFARALDAAGDHEGARAAIRAARERLRERAQQVDARFREGFLGAIPDHRRTFELAHCWLGTPGPSPLAWR